jgi:hypothetical protein
MKKIIAAIFALSIIILIGAMAMASIPESYTDQITTVGQVKRIYFHLLLRDDSTGNQEWHYFGTTAAEATPTTGDPVNEYTYVQLPNDFDDLGPESNSAIEDLAIQAGQKREGLEDANQVNIFSDTVETQGVTRIVTFYLWADGTWYYFGIQDTEPVPDPGMAGPIVEVQDIQFPRDFGQLGEEQNDALYDLGFQIGLKREGLE